MNDLVRPYRRLLVALAGAMAMASCSPADTGPPPLAGARIGGPFALIDQDGHRVTDASFAGRYRIMYFGYTFCPDVCPVDVQTIGAALRLFEARDAARAARVVPIFITVDPERDTPAVLKQFVRAFHPRMVGLTGAPEAIAAVAKEFGVFYSKGPLSPGGGYMVTHARLAFLMDTSGKPVALLPADKKPDDVVNELERWVH